MCLALEKEETSWSSCPSWAKKNTGYVFCWQLQSKPAIAAAITVVVRINFISNKNVVMTARYITTFHALWRAKNVSAFQKTAALYAIIEAAPQGERYTCPHGKFSQPEASLADGKGVQGLRQVTGVAQVG